MKRNAFYFMGKNLFNGNMEKVINYKRKIEINRRKYCFILIKYDNIHDMKIKLR